MLLLVGCAPEPRSPADPLSAPPPAPPAAWLAVIGEYASGADTISVLESEGSLALLPWHGGPRPMTPLSDTSFTLGSGPSYP
jgi:hypothetical protein